MKQIKPENNLAFSIHVSIPVMGEAAVLAAVVSTLSADSGCTSLAFFAGFSLSYTSNQRGNMLNAAQLFYILIKHNCNYFHVRNACKVPCLLLVFQCLPVLLFTVSQTSFYATCSPEMWCYIKIISQYSLVGFLYPPHQEKFLLSLWREIQWL